MSKNFYQIKYSSTSLRVALLLLSVLSLLCPGGPTFAHNLNFGTLTVDQSSEQPKTFQIVFQISGDQQSHLDSSISAEGPCITKSFSIEQRDIIRLRTSQSIECSHGSLDQLSFVFQKLPANSHVLVRLIKDGKLKKEQLLSGDQSKWNSKIPVDQSVLDASLDRTSMGAKHILMGWDHLLFLAMLILLVPRTWGHLARVVTSFTIGHSITLALVTLDVISVPAPPTEALIALSIIFLAAEYVHYQRTGVRSLTIKHPGTIAMLFGLFHGLGFASVLSDIGVPEDQVLLTLASFNLGIEFGQLCFVGLLTLLGYMLQSLPNPLKDRIIPVKIAYVYCGGILGSFWFIERVASFFL